MDVAARILCLTEEALESGRPPEDVCANCPELIDEVRRRLERCRTISAQLGDFFPSNDRTRDGSSQNDLAHIQLPDIPGYAVESVLGHGGMGVVFRARHLKLNRIVAVKMIIAGAYASQVERLRLLREARAVAALSHTNVVQVHDVGETGGRPYFTMEYVPGGSLAQNLDGSPLPIAAAVALLTTLSDAVDAAHTVGIIHRDLKPANILLAADGTPKISDFGLARQSDDDDGLTHSGARIGTPSYMAPEQAAGRKALIGPPADIYALGAILYELLTGRPPFLGENVAETERQLVSEDPVRPSRLNSRVPYDLETICLKCLMKEPRRRYASAKLLAEDLRRFGNREPILARRTPLIERSIKWIWRHPTITTAVTATVLVGAGLIGASFWLMSQRAMTFARVNDSLVDAVAAEHKSDWVAASAAVERARFQLGSRHSGSLEKQISGIADEIAFGNRLETTRMTSSESSGGVLNRDLEDRTYANLFAQARIGREGQDPARVVERIHASNIKDALVIAIDEWTRVAHDARKKWVIEISSRLDPEPTQWRRRLHDPATWTDRHAIEALIDAPIDRQTTPLLITAGEKMRAAGKDPVPFFERIRRARPNDFWANETLADVMREIGRERHVSTLSTESLRYYQAAIALRPTSAQSYNNMGLALGNLVRFDDAAEAYRSALLLDPTAVAAQANLGTVLAVAGKREDSLKPLQAAVRGFPKDSYLHAEYGLSLIETGRFDEGFQQAQIATRAQRVDPLAYRVMQQELLRRGRVNDALENWHLAVMQSPENHKVWDGYAEYCIASGRLDLYREVCGALLKRFAGATDPQICERVARACLAGELPAAQVRQAGVMIDRAIASQQKDRTWLFSYFMLVRGMTDYRLGNDQRAIEIMRTEATSELGPIPLLITALAQSRLGDLEGAQSSLAAASVSYNWGPAEVNQREHWILLALQREAVNKVFPDADRYFDGTFEPRNQDERLIILGLSETDQRHAKSAALWIDAMSAEPVRLAAHRIDAAGAVAIAGCAMAPDAAMLDDASRSRYREIARGWIREDIADCQKLIAQHNPKDAAKRISAFKESKALRGIRDPQELAKLSPAECDQCRQLWSRVSDVLDSAAATQESLAAAQKRQ